MTLPDTNEVILAYLLTQPVATLVSDRIMSPRLYENCDLPAISFFTRGGTSTPYIPGIPTPSVQFDCWADNPIEAREVYRSLYDALQGIQNVKVTIPPTDYYILSALEEIQGQDLIDEIQGYFRVLAFFELKIR